jgi:hypothetical protein
VPVQLAVALSHVCPIEQRIHTKPVNLCVTVPSPLSIKSVVGVVGVAKAAVQKINNISSNKDLPGFKNLSGLKNNLFII